MLYYLGITIGWAMIIGASAKMFYEFNRSVIIKKKDFIKIENKIRFDERRKTLEELNNK